jgi:hypothetical protein
MQNSLLEHYLDDIPDAINRGHLVQYPVEHVVMGYGHEHALTPWNSRLLRPLAVKILKRFDGISEILKFGAGSGPASALMSYLAPNAKITTAGGLSPINPYLRYLKPLLEWNGNEARAANTLARNMRYALSAAGLSNKFQELRTSPEFVSELDVLLQLQREFGLRIFEALDHDKPFIHEQIVDTYPFGTHPLEPGKFDFIYDRQGPHWHTGAFMTDSHNTEQLETDDRQIVVTTTHGALVIKRANPNAELFAELALEE